MRRAIRFRTLFSCPAVVWMAYQRRSGISEQSRHELHEDLLEQRIHETNHDAENGDEDDGSRLRRRRAGRTSTSGWTSSCSSPAASSHGLPPCSTGKI